MRKFLFTLAIASISIFCFGQQKWFIGVEASIANDHLTINDPGQQLVHFPLLAPLVGINIRRDLKRFSVETGFLYKPYDEGIGFKGDFGYSTGTGFNSLIIPIRLKYPVRLNHRSLKLVPVIGYSLGINFNYEDNAGNNPYGIGVGGAGWGWGMYGNTFAYDYQISYEHKSFSLIQSGLGVEFKMLKKMRVNVSANYYAGLNKVYREDVVYQYNSGPSQQATMTSKGQFWSFGIALQYPFTK